MSQANTIERPLAHPSDTAAIVLDKVNKWYGAMHVLRDVSMTVGQGERVWCAGRPARASPP